MLLLLFVSDWNCYLYYKKDGHYKNEIKICKIELFLNRTSSFNWYKNLNISLISDHKLIDKVPNMLEIFRPTGKYKSVKFMKSRYTEVRNWAYEFQQL